MSKITCPFCSTDLVRPAKSCITCSAQITYGKISEDALGFIGISAMILSLITMNVVPKLGIRHPFIVFFVTIGLVSSVGYWRASNIYRDAVRWKRAAHQKEGNDFGGTWHRTSFEHKLRYGFEFHYRKTSGYRPSWCAEKNKYAVSSIQDKWVLWRSFFLACRNQVVTTNSPQDMEAVYLNAKGDKSAGVAVAPTVKKGWRG